MRLKLTKTMLAMALASGMTLCGCGGGDEPTPAPDAPNSAASDGVAPPASPSADSTATVPSQSGGSTPTAPPKTPPPPKPVAFAPGLGDYRVAAPAAQGTSLTARCAMAGTLTVLDAVDHKLGSDRSDSPTVVCVVPATDGARLVKLRFEPADGSPGTQRLLPLAANDFTIEAVLAPPTGRDGRWTLTSEGPSTRPVKPIKK